MGKLIKGVNDLATVNPQLAKEWHPTKNGELKPTDVFVGSWLKVWWYLPYDDPHTGKHFDFEWEARVSDRACKKSGCPYLYGKKAWYGFNDLETYCKNNNIEYILDEWDYYKNDNLQPSDITYGSNKKVWWILPYDDPKTGKHFDFEWQATIIDMVRGKNCPYFSGHRIWKGFNDLETYCKENNYIYILNEWDYDKNGDLTPSNVTVGSGKKVHWICPNGHTYKMSMDKRIHAHRNCPICAKEHQTSFSEQAIYYYLSQNFDGVFNKWVKNNIEFDIYIPLKKIAVEYDGAYWHQDLTHDLKKNKYCNDNKIMLYRIRESDCPSMKDEKYIKVIPCTKNENDLEIAIINLCKCLGLVLNININNDRQYIWNQYLHSKKKNCFAEKYPILASQWHPTKNGFLLPNMVSCCSGKRIWWYYPYDDPITGYHFDFEWQAKISSRVSNGGRCPYITGNAVWKGFNDLETYCKQNNKTDLLQEWDYKKNGQLNPTNVTSKSNRRVWWLLSYTDPKTKKHFNFEWKARILDRINGSGCPYLSNYAVCSGFNDLETYCKENSLEYILDRWDYQKNNDIKPSSVTRGSSKKIWWIDENGNSVLKAVHQVIRNVNKFGKI